jgi:hypothetical protein
MTALLLLKRFWPVLAGLAVLTALWGWGNSRYRDGMQTERQAWQVARVELLELRRRKADWSAAKLAERLDAIPNTVTKETIRVETHWRDRPVRECFDAGLVQSLEEARAAIRRSPAPSTSDGGLPASPGVATPGD